MQKFVKKMYRRPKQEDRTRSEEKPKEDDKSQERPKSTVREIRMINGGPMTGGSFRSLKKSQRRQVNSVHMIPPMKNRRKEAMDMVFFEEDTRGMKQSHDDPLDIMLMIEGFNNKRILVDNRSSADIIYLFAFQ